MNGPVPSCLPCGSPGTTLLTPSALLPPTASEAAAEALYDMQLEQFPPVRSPWLSRWGGLGHGQGQLGANFLAMAQHDKPEHMRRALSPMLPGWFRRCASLAAVLAPFVFLAVISSQISAGAPISKLNLAALLGALFSFICCAPLVLLPDPGISVHFRMLDDGQAGLHIAARHGSLGAARMLLDQGAEVDLRDLEGRTALHHAAEWRQLELAELLLENGADAHATDMRGKKPYQLVKQRSGPLWTVLGGPTR